MAVKYDDRTIKGWPLPHQQNRLYDDVDRVRQALTLIDEAVRGIETSEGSIGDRQTFIETRLDTIAGQATEDTEILDARVDAEGVVHPNLGHAIRNAHVTLVGLVDDFQGVLRQFDSLAEAQIQGELNGLEAHERRKKEIQLEVLTRLLQDDGLQRQINEASTAILQTALNLKDEIERRRTDIEQEQIARATDVNYLQEQIFTLSKLLELLTDALSDTDNALDIETQARVDSDLGLARQANANAEAVLRTGLNLLDTNQRRKSEILREEESRIAGDADSQSQLDELAVAGLENSLAIAQEAEQRREDADEAQSRFEYLCDEDVRLDAKIDIESVAREAKDEALHSEIEAEKATRAEQISGLDEKIDIESQARIEGDLGLARQSNANAEASIQNALNITEASERRKADLAHEEKTRISHDADLQAQVDKTSTAGLENTLAIAQEAETRRANITDINVQIDGLKAENLERKAEIQAEADERNAHDEELHEAILSEKTLRERQIDEVNEALDVEAQARATDDLGLARQSNANAEAILQTELNILDADQRRKDDLAHEEEARIARDEDLQRQVDTASEASISNALNLHEEATERRKVREALDIEIQQRTEHDAQQNEAIAQNARDIGTERQERVEGELGLSRQANANAEANIQNALSIREASERRKEDLAREEQSRIQYDEDLQEQIDTNAETSIQNSLNLSDSNEARRQDLAREEEARISHDTDLQRQINKTAEASLENAISIHAEAEQRRKAAENLTEEIARNADNDTHNQAQIATLVNAILEDALNLRDEISRRREALIQESQARITGDADLQAQVDEASTAGLENSLAIAQEAEQRRQSDERIEALRDESAHQREVDEYHQTQIDDVVRATLENSTALSEVLEHRRTDLVQETQERLAHDTDLQAQVDEASAAGIENTLAISHEAEQRRTFGDRIETLERDSESSFKSDIYQREQLDYLVDAILQDALNLRDEVERRREAIETGQQELIARTGDMQIQIDQASEGIIEDSLAVQKSNETRRAEDSQERFTRFDEDGHIQDQVNTLAETCLRIMTSTAETQAKIEKIAQAAEAISGTTGVADDSEVDEMLAEIP